MKTTTQRVYLKDMLTLKRWMKKLNMSFAELIHEWINFVDLKLKEKFYNKLTPITNYKEKPKRLSSCRIDRNRFGIQKRVTTCE